MSNFSTMISDLKMDNLHKLVQNGQQKYLCFTRLKPNGKSLMVEVSDGIDIWLLEMDSDDLETQKDLNNVSGSDAFLNKIKSGFTTGDLNVARVGSKVTLTIGKGTSTISMDLFEARAAEKKTEFQCVLFRMAENCAHLETEVTSANQRVETLKAQKAAAPGGLLDLSPKKGVGPGSKAKPTKAGMSVVNPTSRKRKAATGVVFGE